MRLAALLALAASAGMASAEPVILKSGVRGEMAMAVTTAPEDLGGPTSGNLVELHVRLDSLVIDRPEVEGRSICHRYGLSFYEAAQRNADTLPDAIAEVVDMTAPLAAVRVVFAAKVGESTAIQLVQDYDMRGVQKCRPIE